MSSTNNSKTPKSSKDFVMNATLSFCSSAISKTLVAPLERIKLLLQNQYILNDLSVKYKGNIDCAIRVWKEQGVLSFWRGNMANVYRYAPNFALIYSLKETFKKLFAPTNNKYRNILNNILSAAFAGVLSTFVTYPLDFARTKIGVDVGHENQRKYKGITSCLIKYYKLEGFKGIYAGFSITCFGAFFYRGLMFGLHDSKSKNHTLFFQYLTSVATTGISGMVLLPLDTIRRRLMVETGEKNKLYKGIFDCIRVIYKQEGFIGFSKGGYSNFIRSFGTAFTLVFNDFVVYYYKKIFK